MSCLNITQHFDKYFQLIVANTAELKQEVFSIRYQVYCEELNFEPAKNFPDGLEKDIYDDHSIHCLLKHRSKEIYAGCVRVVLPQEQNSIKTFPLEKVFHKHFSLTQTNRTDFCEISRLAVTSQFRKRQGETNVPEGILFFPSDRDSMQYEKRRFPVIALSLYWSSISLALVHKLDILSIMEPRLARHLKRFGIISNRIGELVEHRGKRGLFLIEPTKLIKNLDNDMQNLFEFIHTDIQNQLPLKLATISNYFK